MANLPAIIRATRQSAMAIERMQRANRLVRTARWKNDLESALKSYKRAERDYIRAQTILDNNPL
jgi:hypothetical protein